MLHLYDYTDELKALYAGAKEYCADYSLIRRQCVKNIDGHTHFGVASVSDCKNAILLKGEQHGRLGGLTFHTHGGPHPGEIYFPNGGQINAGNIWMLKEACSRYLANEAEVLFWACGGDFEWAVRRFVVAAGQAMLSHSSGWIVAYVGNTYFGWKGRNPRDARRVLLRVPKSGSPYFIQ